MSITIDTQSPIMHSLEEKSSKPCLQKQFLTHFKLYSFVSSTRDIILMVPLARQCAISIAPAYLVIRDTYPIKAVMDRGDPIADGALKKLDSVVPGLKTYDYGNFLTPFSRPVNGTLENSRRVFTNSNETIKTTIIEPSAKTVHDLRDRFHYVVYDNNGKGIITSTADPLVAPFNDYLENLVVKHLPASQPDSKEHSSELSRTVQLIAKVIRGNKSDTKNSAENEGTEKLINNETVEETAQEESDKLTQ